ncbi:dTDP-glucose 4,6-dehydratase [Alicyclobacillus sp. SO9]|uniref:dTDP-glucose 4,6-dehydratase n=1 Tax=Alicyclobacillus sp. SO9 TaxID=2665646 RepID=UPI0018E8D094|nr:dTDP-glucose 4,6-dehydratase [Alicyclobacillus sp. SO9]QQE79200.1 dTDP-glucose 4,6-dehydratase [Alicyclobacillus sp. SO9]
MRIVVTGGAGFIGSNFIQYMSRKYPDYELVNVDSLTYAGNLENFKDIDSLANYSFIKVDITDSEQVSQLFSQRVDAIVHFAAESHVDRSILDPGAFLKTNVMGTQVLLEAARQHGVGKFVHVSTDEVYGSLGDTGTFSENSPLASNSPYSASKASSDLLVRAYHETYGLPVNITRCSNNYGPYQFPEKLIPLMILNALEGQPLPVYGDGLNVRDWLHVEDHCAGIDLVLHQGRDGEVYNIGGNNERTNIEIVKTILNYLNKPESLIRFVEDRLGHDKRYAIDATKLRSELGWEPQYSFDTGIAQTIQWYLDNRSWWERVRSGDYREYYEKQYSSRLGDRL